MITVEKIKTLIPLAKNIDNGLLQPHIQYAEEKYIKPVLGKNLYVDIQSKYSGQTLSSIEQELVAKCQISLAFYITDNALPFLSLSITEKGLQQQNGIFSENADAQSKQTALNYMRNEMRNSAEFYADSVRDFLEDNKDSFPLYTSANNDPKKETNFDCGVAFYGKSNSTYNYYTY